jgi:outer membrane protein assembly factor BamB
MKRFASALAIVVLAAAGGRGQDPTRLYSHPSVPSREVLDRLNLELAWFTYIPAEDRREGLESVQVAGKDLLVQTRRGTLCMLDAETGRTRWHWRSTSTSEPQPPSFNRRTVFVANGTRLVALDRATGDLRWDYDLAGAATAAPLADNERVYVIIYNKKLVAYELPAGDKVGPPLPGFGDKAARKGSAPDKGMRRPEPSMSTGDKVYGPTTSSLFTPPNVGKVETVGPRILYEHFAESYVNLPPVQSEDVLLYLGINGTIYSASKVSRFERYHLPTDGTITVAPGQHGDTAYIASEDRNVYALNITTGKAYWRYTAGSSVAYAPAVNDEDLYVTTKRTGMARVRRSSGDEVWKTAGADRFLAANPKFVYATDRTGRLLVLDRRRGTLLSSYDTHDFVFPVRNESTDRLFLAANDGLIVCLHDKEYATPVQMKKPDPYSGERPPDVKPDKAKKAPKAAPKEEPKDEMPADKPKDKPKDKDKDS